MSNQTSITWQAPEFKDYHKNLGWYITLTAITILTVAFFVIVEDDIFAAVTLGLIGILIFIFSRQKPQIVNIELNDRGIQFANIFYPYKQLKFFWVVHNQNHQTINVITSAFINNLLILELLDQDPEEIRKFLIKYIPEHQETQETPIQRIMHKLKF